MFSLYPKNQSINPAEIPPAVCMAGTTDPVVTNNEGTLISTANTLQTTEPKALPRENIAMVNSIQIQTETISEFGCTDMLPIPQITVQL